MHAPHQRVWEPGLKAHVCNTCRLSDEDMGNVEPDDLWLADKYGGRLPVPWEMCEYEASISEQVDDMELREIHGEL